MKNNILGVDLKIDQEYIANCVKDVVKASMSEALGSSEKITKEVVQQLLNTKVDKDSGKISNSSWGTEPIIDHYLRTEITEVVKEEVKEAINKKRGVLKDMIGKELQKKSNLEKFVDSFINNTAEQLERGYRTTIDIQFTKKEEY